MAALKKKKDIQRMNAAAAFLGAAGVEPKMPMRLDLRHVATLRVGAIVGEIALFKTGEKRMATVRTADNVEILTLDKKSFLQLDPATLNIISENARYNAACTKEPGQRERADLHILQQRTAHLSELSSLSSEVHLELCRVMRYRQINGNTILVRKGHAATCLMIIISGSVATHAAEPRAKHAQGWGAVKEAHKKRGKAHPVEAYEGMKPQEVRRAGQAIGEDELLQEDPVYGVTAITAEDVELMEIERDDFDRILKADRTSEKGRLIDFLNGLSMMEGTSVAAIHALSNVIGKKTFMRDQFCLAHPPEPSLGASAFHQDYVYLIYSGEARLLCGNDADEKRIAPPIDGTSPPYGPLIERPPPAPSRVEKYLGTRPQIVAVATLGPGECVSDNLLPLASTCRWALRAITPLDLLVIPRKEWNETLRSSSSLELRELLQVKAGFFLKQRDARLQQQLAEAKTLSRSASTSKVMLAPLKSIAPLDLPPPATPIEGPPPSPSRPSLTSGSRATLASSTSYPSLQSPGRSQLASQLSSQMQTRVPSPTHPFHGRSGSPPRKTLNVELPPMGYDPTVTPKSIPFELLDRRPIRTLRKSAMGMRPLQS